MSADARSRYYSVLRVPFGLCVCKKKSNALFFLQMGHSDGSTCSTKNRLLLRAIYEMLQKYKWSKAIWGNKWHVKSCSDTISSWYRWFEPARLGGWSCNKQVIQLMGVESVTTDSCFVNVGTGGIPLLGGSPAAATAPWLLLAVAALAGAAVGECCTEEAEFVFQQQLSIESCARGCGGTRGLCGVPELLSGCPEPEGAGGALGVCSFC